MFVVHPARIKCRVAQGMGNQEFLAEVLKFLSTTHPALLSKARGTRNSRAGAWYQKALARGDRISLLHEIPGGGGTTRGQDKAQVPQNAWGRHGVHVVEVSVVEVTR